MGDIGRAETGPLLVSLRRGAVWSVRERAVVTVR